MSVKSDPTQPAALLDLENVSVMRGLKVVLDRIHLRVDQSEHVAILGPNGCGKSTFIKTITRECYPVADECSSIKILGESSWNVFELRSLLGIVSNDLMSSCISEATASTLCFPVFSAVRASFPTIRLTPNTGGSPKPLCFKWAFLIWVREPSSGCPREKRNAS